MISRLPDQKLNLDLYLYTRGATATFKHVTGTDVQKSNPALLFALSL